MNEHNPIALAITQLQQKWEQSIKKQDYQLVRWVIEKANADIFKGFLKLESTAHGSLEETFIILFTPFESPSGFAYALAKDWLDMFETEMQKGNLPLWSDFEALKEELKGLSADANYAQQDLQFLSRLLRSFKQYEGKSTKLILGLLPYGISNHRQYTEWLKGMLKYLPEELALMIVDYAEDEKQSRLFDKAYPERISIQATNLYNAAGIYRELATAGNPDDPQVQFRVCMFEMGEAAKSGNKSALQHWGDRALLVAQGAGDKLFWASAHIVYAGFLFGFKDTAKIEKLLDTGVFLCEDLLGEESKRMSAAGLLGQFYGYKAAYLSILKKHKESISYFEKQAAVLLAHDQALLSLGAFQNAILVASKHQRGKVAQLAEQGFAVGYPLADELLRSSGFPLIAYYYLKNNLADENLREAIEERLASLYSTVWKRNAKKHLAIAPEEYVT